MAILNVNPTRMELLRLKRQVVTAKRGHKLLSEKQDGLMQKFMEIIREAKVMRKEVEEKLGMAFKSFMLVSAVMYPKIIEQALMFPKAKVSLDVKTKNVMSVLIPEFELTQEGDVHSYGFLQSSGDLDISLGVLSEILTLLVNLAQIEQSAKLLAEEIEKTRRRVNALEYVLIPDLEETVKFIQMKLSEQERAAITNTMIIKDMMEAEAAA